MHKWVISMTLLHSIRNICSLQIKGMPSCYLVHSLLLKLIFNRLLAGEADDWTGLYCRVGEWYAGSGNRAPCVLGRGLRGVSTFLYVISWFGLNLWIDSGYVRTFQLCSPRWCDGHAVSCSLVFLAHFVAHWQVLSIHKDTRRERMHRQYHAVRSRLLVSYEHCLLEHGEARLNWW